MPVELIELNLFQQKNFKANPLLVCGRNSQIIGAISNDNQSNTPLIIFTKQSL